MSFHFPLAVTEDVLGWEAAAGWSCGVAMTAGGEELQGTMQGAVSGRAHGRLKALFAPLNTISKQDSGPETETRMLGPSSPSPHHCRQ